MKRRIVLPGPPESGKGIQAAMLDSDSALPVSPGAIVREKSPTGTAIGIEAGGIANGGCLAPDMMTSGVTSTCLERQTANGFDFGEYPRTLGGMEVAGEMSDGCGAFSTVGSKVLIGVCGSGSERCVSEFSRRKYGSVETSDVRFQEYPDKALPVANYCGNRHLSSRVEAEGCREHVFAGVCQILNRR